MPTSLTTMLLPRQLDGDRCEAHWMSISIVCRSRSRCCLATGDRSIAAQKCVVVSTALCWRTHVLTRRCYWRTIRIRSTRRRGYRITYGGKHGCACEHLRFARHVLVRVLDPRTSDLRVTTRLGVVRRIGMVGMHSVNALRVVSISTSCRRMKCRRCGRW